MRPSTAPNADRIEALEAQVAALERKTSHLPKTPLEDAFPNDHKTQACSNARNHPPHAWNYSMANGGGQYLCSGVTGAVV